MQITPDVSWGWADFLVAAALLFGAGTAVVLAIRWSKRPAQKVLAVLGVVLPAALAWAELAVGLFR